MVPPGYYPGMPPLPYTYYPPVYGSHAPSPREVEGAYSPFGPPPGGRPRAGMHDEDGVQLIGQSWQGLFRVPGLWNGGGRKGFPTSAAAVVLLSLHAASGVAVLTVCCSAVLQLRASACIALRQVLCCVGMWLWHVGLSTWTQIAKSCALRGGNAALAHP